MISALVESSKQHPAGSERPSDTASSVATTAKPGSLVLFFALAFGLSWIVWIPATLASYGLLPVRLDSTLGDLLGAFGPFFAALVTTAIYEGRAGFRALFRRLLIWRVGARWYLFVLLWPALLSLANTGIAVALGRPLPDFSRPPFLELYPLPPEVASATPVLAFLPLVFLQQMLVGSSMGEEIGWRGYALPRLQSDRSALRAGLLLGFLWGLWHLPLWLATDHPIRETAWGWPILGLMATSVLFTWVYNNTRGSLLLALVFHTSIAITGLFLASAAAPPLVDAALTWAAAGLVIARFGPERLATTAMNAER